MKQLKNPFQENKKVLVSKISAKENLKTTIQEAVNKIGGFEKLNLPGKRVLLKPNFNTADPFPASSDPLFVVALIELLYEYGASQVILGESCTFSQNTRKVLNKRGMIELAEKAGAPVHIFTEYPYLLKKISGKTLKKAKIPEIFDEIDSLIYSCCLKTHYLGDFTMSLKMTMGIVKPSQRIAIHTRKLREKFADLNTVVSPALIFVDGRKCFITGGPERGEVRNPNLVLASGDRIAIDIEGIKIIQSFPGNNLAQDPWEYPQIKRAVDLGIGVKSESEYKVA